MALIQHLPQHLSLPAIHAHWTAALSLPPTAQLSNLRRLVRALTKDIHPALRPLSLTALCPLYLDLALAYAFLGEYFLASQVFKEAVGNDPTSAVGWFGLGLAHAELKEWRNARRSWKECLRCFGSVDGPKEGLRYVVFQAQDKRMLEVGLDPGSWTLERTRVEFNLRVALCEKGSKTWGVAPRAADQKRPTLHGLSAGIRFGPGWGADLHSLDPPLLAEPSSPHPTEPGDGAGFTSEPRPAPQTPPSSRSSHPSASLPPRVSSRKPLPALPRSPQTPLPSLADDGSFNDHKPSRDEDPFTSSDGDDVLDPFDTSSQTLIARPYDEYHGERFSLQPTLFTAEDQCFYDHSDEDNEDDDNDGESRDTYTAIDDTIASWSSIGRTISDQTEEDPTHPQHSSSSASSTVANEPPQDPPSDFDTGEILQPLVFEGFGAAGQERRRRWDSGLVRQWDRFPGNGNTFRSVKEKGVADA